MLQVAIRFYNGFLTLNEPISNIFITSNHKATEKQRLYRLYRSTRDSAATSRWPRYGSTLPSCRRHVME